MPQTTHMKNLLDWHPFMQTWSLKIFSNRGHKMNHTQNVVHIVKAQGHSGSKVKKRGFDVLN